ncbi:hypothetical protein CLAFUW4_02285 [Fulvia fulva]|uniref:Uncharacterized protein n=1 Tax=Passalora fulva TaxID=5499 RepID=A0A9Q8L579_PASFU|nr:uncharacterized protein CLAFUR5_02275 [Fulvia fulva]KAK4638504.1 hypothetical protein CLAFUR0_02284 [Fulvia fulva]UJO11029.1 hypothetical protein CLAFUR5_02275 [Fulvia fulva]WPV10409.1 hypothetical protein CLAFUW4_02285 [Fulvia fulva]
MSQRSSESTASQETSINTAINSSSTSITEADKPVFSTPGFSKVERSAMVPGEAVAADEVDMKNAENYTTSKESSSSFFSSSSSSKQEGSSSFFSSSSSRNEASNFFGDDVVSPTQVTTTTEPDGKDFPGAFPSELG